MAKKRKKHSGGRAPSGAAQTTATAGKRSGDSLFAPETIKPTPASPGGPNRPARKEEARRERERLRKKIARRRFYRRGGQVAVALLVVAGLVFFLTRPKQKLNAEEQALIDQAPAAAAAAGCDTVQAIAPYSPDSQDTAHIGSQNGPATPPELSTYSSVPPASGPHDTSPLPGGVLPEPPDVYRTIHSMEHGAAIIWYDPAASTEQIDELTQLQTFFEKPGEDDHVIVAPYSYPDQGDAGKLPAGKLMVMVAWHHMQTCNDISLPVAYQFVHSYAATPKGAYRGDAPEAGASIG